MSARRVIRLIVFETLLLTACATPPASTAPPTPVPAATLTNTPVPTPDAVAAMDSLLSKFTQQQLFSGAVLVARDGQILLSKGYGLANREQSLANTPQTKFRLASVSKQFTAMAILILENQGKLDVQASVCKYIPDCPAQWQPVTLHHLLTHTSGIGDISDGSFQSITATTSPVEQAVLLFRDTPLLFAAGTSFQYSTSGYILLGYVIEQVSGQTYQAFLHQHIFDPLGMANSGLQDNLDGLAVGYDNAYSRADPIDVSVYSAGGGLYSTVEDLYRWDQALYTESLVPRAALDRMFRVQAPAGDYGYGWFIGAFNGHRLVAHGGQLPDFRSQINRYLDDHFVVILLSNQGDVSADTIAELLAGKVLKS